VVASDWDGIVGRLGPVVFSTAWRILGHAADTEDVVQDVFLEAYQLQLRQPVRSWEGLLRRLAACRALDRLRRRQRAAPLEALALPGPSADPADAAIGRELAERLRQALAQLPEREAAVFSLRYFEDLSHQAIADALNISPGAAATALHKARARLRALLTETPSGDRHECP
jgi:RNA polymerase sigma-70 factor (ECF subfamily)